MLAPESTTNYISSSLIVDGAGKLLSLVGEKNAALSVSSNFKKFLAKIHASPRADRSSPPEIYPQISLRRTENKSA